MKTKMYLSTLLAVVIHVMVIGQTQVNPVFQHNKNFVLGYANFTEEEKREFAAVDDPSVLLIQADELIARARMIKKEAGVKRGEEQKRLLDNANELLERSEIMKLAAAEILAYNNRTEFKILKASFIDLLGNYDATDSTVIESKKLLLAAIRSYRFAVELREEAYAQRNVSAILANLHNAEERENIAIINIVQAMKKIEVVVPQVIAIR